MNKHPPIVHQVHIIVLCIHSCFQSFQNTISAKGQVLSFLWLYESPAASGLPVALFLWQLLLYHSIAARNLFFLWVTLLLLSLPADELVKAEAACSLLNIFSHLSTWPGPSLLWFWLTPRSSPPDLALPPSHSWLTESSLFPNQHPPHPPLHPFPPAGFTIHRRFLFHGFSSFWESSTIFRDLKRTFLVLEGPGLCPSTPHRGLFHDVLMKHCFRVPQLPVPLHGAAHHAGRTHLQVLGQLVARDMKRGQPYSELRHGTCSKGQSSSAQPFAHVEGSTADRWQFIIKADTGLHGHVAVTAEASLAVSVLPLRRPACPTLETPKARGRRKQGLLADKLLHVCEGLSFIYFLFIHADCRNL